jgi:predicted helicase
MTTGKTDIYSRLARTDFPDRKVRGTGQTPSVILKADRKNGIIVLDAESQLAGVPREAWDYQLGNRSALEWVLDQHRERSPKDPTISREIQHAPLYRL